MKIVDEYTSKVNSEAVGETGEKQNSVNDTELEKIKIDRVSEKSDEALQPLFDAIVGGRLESAVEVTKQAIADGVAPQEIINKYMIKAMGEVGQRFQDGKAFVPQLLMAGRAMKGAL